MKVGNTILITGVPRSGSTLICQLLSQVPDVVVLDEPLEEDYASYRLPGSRFVSRVTGKLSEWRSAILRDGAVVSVQRDQRLSQHYSDEVNAEGLRERIVTCSTVAIDKQLSDDFILIAKQLLAFSVHQDDLLDHFSMFGVVRNPLAVLCSLNTLHSWKRGYFEPYSRLAPELVARWETIDDKIDRLIEVISIYYDKCQPLLDRGRIIRYEDLIATRGRILDKIVPLPAKLVWALDDRNINQLYDRASMLRIGEALLDAEGAFWNFYSRESVAALLDRAIGGGR